MIQPDDSFEHALMTRPGLLIAGIDEVGRGPLAGPVTAAAVILDLDRLPQGLNDSKKLSAARRVGLSAEIAATAEVSLAWASVEEIDTLNIRNASLLAMRRAVEGLPRRPDHALIDGNALPPGLPCDATTIIKGDARSVSIAAASIIAKVARDTLMIELSERFPGYGWDRNAGYPTAEHRAALQHLGVTPHHRRSFRPVHNILEAKAPQVVDSHK